MPRQMTLDARLVADLTSDFALSEKNLVFGFGLAGELLVASRLSSEEVRVTVKGGGSVLKTLLDAPSDYRILLQSGEASRRVELRGEHVPCAYVQPVPEGVLMVGARCGWRAQGAEHNAVVYDLSGQVVRRFTLGDGINDVRASPEGTLWVSYFDEGVVGNRGWRNPGPEPLGRSGLVQFDGAGQRLQEFDAEAAGATIVDAYALNLVSAQEAWVNVYPGFSLVRVQAGQYQSWKTDTTGASAMAVRGKRVALFGGYQGDSLLRILELERGKPSARCLVEARITLEGAPLGAHTPVTGVGPTLYFVEGRQVFALSDW